MAEQNEVDKTNDPRRKDLRILVAMLAVYALCCVIFITGSFIWIRNDRKAANANATATEGAIATLRANATITAVAHTTEQAKYQFVEKFDSNVNLWRAQQQDNDYWKGNIRVADGTYIWDVEETKQTFIHWANLPRSNYIEKFYTYVDTKIPNTEPGGACSGFLFRVAPSGWDDGGYYFALCNNSLVKIYYHTEWNGWEKIKMLYYGNYVDDWNRLEISARGSHFSFLLMGNWFTKWMILCEKVGDWL